MSNQILIIFAENLNKLTADEYEGLCDLIPSDLVLESNKFRFWQDRQASVLGKLLVKKALSLCKLDFTLKNLLYTSYGRPYIPDCPDFSISHTPGLVVCAMNLLGRIGVDVECVKSIDYGNLISQFHEDEILAIEKSNKGIYKFYEIWTRKEAVLKADGRGLSFPLGLNSWSISDKKKVCLEGRDWQLISRHFSDNHVLSLAIEGCMELTADNINFYEYSFIN